MSRTVLTVDDSRTMRAMLKLTLGDAGYTVVQAENGQEGLDRFDEIVADVIITDINMPVMDGITFIKRLRQTVNGRATPILILTTESSDAKKAEGRAAGATGWIVKPFDPVKLVKVVEKVCP